MPLCGMALHLLQGGLGGETLVILEYAPAAGEAATAGGFTLGDRSPSPLAGLVRLLMRAIVRRQWQSFSEQQNIRGKKSFPVVFGLYRSLPPEGNADTSS